MFNKLDDALSFQQQALSLRAKRQGVLATNIANADTPFYKARDFDFSTTLERAVAGHEMQGLSLSRTTARHLSSSVQAGTPQLLYRKEIQSSVDGNTVDMDVERAQFAENAMQYEASLTFITHQIKMLTAAVQP